jgi:NACalpha-BTF3-like transcription factor
MSEINQNKQTLSYSQLFIQYMKIKVKEEKSLRGPNYKEVLLMSSDINLTQSTVSCNKQRAIDALWRTNGNVSAAINLLKSFM